MAMESLTEKVISQGDLISESLYRKTKSFLPFVARLCLLSHFLQQNYILFHHRRHILHHFGDVVTVVFIACFFTRTIAVFMALFNKKVTLSCCLLFVSNVVEKLFQHSFPDISRLLVNVSTFGSLFLLLAESLSETKSMYAGIPKPDDFSAQDYITLVGRCLIVPMFINCFSLEFSYEMILQDLIGLAMIILVIVGYRTKFIVLVAILYVNIFNIDDNDWWTIEDDPHERMEAQHRFLEGISVTGGLLMLILNGPGEISIDKRKKT